MPPATVPLRHPEAADHQQFRVHQLAYKGIVVAAQWYATSRFNGVYVTFIGPSLEPNENSQLSTHSIPAERLLEWSPCLPERGDWVVMTANDMWAFWRPETPQ